MKINLQIEHLVLQGFQLTPTDRLDLAATIQTELKRLLISTERSQSWTDLGDRALVQGRSIRYKPGSNHTHLGEQIAASIYSGLSHNSKDQQRAK